jgi:hypothetical protein
MGPKDPGQRSHTLGLPYPGVLVDHANQASPQKGRSGWASLND